MHHRPRNAHSPSHALCVNTASVRAQPQLVCVSSFGFPHNVCRRLVFCYLPGIELHPVFVVNGYSHRTVQTSSESKPGAMAQVLSRASRMAILLAGAATPYLAYLGDVPVEPIGCFSPVFPARTQGDRSQRAEWPL